MIFSPLFCDNVFLFCAIFILGTISKRAMQFEHGKFFPKVFIFGDSLTQSGFHEGGWCTKLVQNYDSGYTTRMSKLILHNLLAASNFPKGSLYAAVLFLGTNDSVLRDRDDRAVPLDEYRENLKQIVHQMENAGIAKERIMIISPPPIDVVKWGEIAKLNGFQQTYSNERVSHYAEACCQISKELNVQNLDLWTEMQSSQNWTSFFMDGLHFGEIGHEFVYLKVKEKFDLILGDLKMVYPDWKNVDHIHPEKSFSNVEL